MGKKVRVKDILHVLNQFAPPSLAEDWDKVGLQVGTIKAPVEGVLVSLDVTEEVLQDCFKQGANLLITHHPLFLRDLKRSDRLALPRRLIRSALRKRIQILSFHTNLDSTEEGLNDLLSEKLDLKKVIPFLPAGGLRKTKAGLGRIGHIKKSKLKAFVRTVARSLHLKNLRYVEVPRQSVRKVAVVTGSGAGFFREAKKAGADVLVTGDVKYHTALEAMAEKIALVDVGHFASEIGMVSLIAERLRLWSRQRGLGLKIVASKVQEDPFRFWP